MQNPKETGAKENGYKSNKSYFTWTKRYDKE